MAQIFHRSTNFIARFTVFSFIFIMGFAVLAVLQAARSPYLTRQNITREQPVQFSHKHHVGDDGIDCRYCHTSVETSAFAGIPPTKTCMNCHSVLFNNAGYLEPVRESYRDDKSIRWVKIHRLADFVYFNHSIHVNKGVGCSTCHGHVDEMPLDRKSTRLNSSHEWISYAVFCLKKKKRSRTRRTRARQPVQPRATNATTAARPRGTPAGAGLTPGAQLTCPCSSGSAGGPLGPMH